MKILYDAPLAPYTSLNVGGNAEELMLVDSYDEMLDAVRTAPAELHVFGFGCNSLIADTGLSGRTVIWRSGDISFENNSVTVDAGVWWDDLVKQAITHRLWGLELMSEIPSSVGGAILGNIAAYGGQVSDTLDWIELYDLDSKKLVRHPASDIEFTYRHSSLQDKPNLIVLRAGFNLSSEPVQDFKYDSALSVAASLGITPDTLQNRREIVVETRKKAGSIYHPNEAGFEHTAGSFFKNPLVSYEQARHLASFDESGKTLERIEHQNTVHGGASNRASAAHVLLAAGFKRGQTWGMVRLHPHHVLKIETLSGATATEVYSVANQIITTVKQKLDIDIVAEVRFIGF